MAVSIQKASKATSDTSIVLLADKKTKWSAYQFTEKEVAYITRKLKDDEKLITVNQFDRLVCIVIPKDKKERYAQLEDMRMAGSKICAALNSHKQKQVIVEDVLNDSDAALAIVEGIALSNYQFLKYRSDAAKEKNTVETIAVNSKKLDKKELDQLSILIEATCKARTLVNEPQSYLSAPKLAEEIQKMGEETALQIKV